MNGKTGSITLILVIIILTLLAAPSESTVPAAAAPVQQPDDSQVIDPPQLLSPVWGPAIQRWDSYIGILADFYGLDPDFIAAVIQEESGGDPMLVSRVGAVGLMGIMPTGPGLEWRPPADELVNPSANLRWGVAILSEIVRQSGGDLFAALAAYSGGWHHANQNVPRQYAARVLDNYSRAVVVRNGYSPDIATQWTLAVEIRIGDVPNESLLVLGDQPISGLHTYGEHIVYDYVDQSGQAYYVKAYAVPLALIAPIGADAGAEVLGSADSLDALLQARLDQTTLKISDSNPRIIAACLPSLSRLRGHASTRWFAPSSCPSWHR